MTIFKIVLPDEAYAPVEMACAGGALAKPDQTEETREAGNGTIKLIEK